MTRSLEVLIVDDRMAVLRSMRLLLGIRHRVHLSTEPEHALALVRELPLDVVIVDYALGGPRGLDLLAQVERLEPGTRRVLMSGDECLLRAKPPPYVDALLRKPFSPNDLLEALTS